eukprot:SAG31_NODE_2132_length_6374_cov_2.836813_2_plen_92_part_00
MVHFGVVGDGVTKDTVAVEKAVAAVKAAGAGTVYCLDVEGKRCEWSEGNLAEFGLNATHCGLCSVDSRMNSHQVLLSSPGVGRWCDVAVRI